MACLWLAAGRASVPRRKRAYLRLGACAWTAIEAIHQLETELSQAPPATAQPFEQRQQVDWRDRKDEGMRKEQREQGN